MRLFTSFLFFIAASLPCISSQAQLPTAYNPAEIKLALKKLNTVGTVLFVAAHPDDENTRLLSYLASEKLLRTCYLSITRGDGGQNLIGKEQGDLLGVIRTNELMMARSIDGAEQYFTRAVDFGYSKSPDETLNFWNHDSVLADVVYLIRKLQPDVIITRFPTTGEGGHGHHTASAILAGEAFKAAADSTKFPNQLNTVGVWQAKSLWWNTFNFGSSNTTSESQLHFDAGVFNNLLGKSYSEIAAQSRSQHKSQGFGVAVNRGKNIEYFKPIAGDTACSNLFCDMDLSWSRIKGAEKIKTQCQKLLKQFDMENPMATTKGLIEVRNELTKLSNTHWREQKLKEVDRLILACSRIWFEAVADNYYAVPGDSMKVKFNCIGYSGVDAQVKNISLSGIFDSTVSKSLVSKELFSVENKFILPSATPFSNHYWLAKKHDSKRYNVSDLALVGKPVNDAALKLNLSITILNQDFQFSLPVRYKWTDPVEGEKYRAVDVVPAATINFNEKVCMMVNNQPQKIKVTVHSFKDSLTGTVRIDVPEIFSVSPSSFPVSFNKKGEEKTFEFTLSSIINNTQLEQSEIPLYGKTSNIHAVFTSGGKSLSFSHQELKYNHIPYQLIFSEASLKVSSLQLAIKGKNIGYIEGAGDEVAQCLGQMGYSVTQLAEADLQNENLAKYDAIIAGVRAYNTNDWMMNCQTKLMEYVNNGGNYIVQYNTNNNLGKLTQSIGPYPFKISRDRVTDEEAAINFLVAEHPIVNSPNKITDADFKNWVQERGIYFAQDYDKNYQAIFSCNDANEKPLLGSTITTTYGKGNFTYTGLAFFRQLPAGVPGAYRLLANIISMGKK